MIFAFTGTRLGMTPEQKRGVILTLNLLQPRTLIHGGAKGADSEAHNLAHEFEYTDAPPFFEVWPADERSSEHWIKILTHTDGRLASRVHPVMLPLARDLVMAKQCDHLIACPATTTEVVRSGTWATIRYARAARKPITIIAPDGIITEEP